jgi:6-phosphogluconate dehydrogenase (decarboxylating)
MQPGMIGLGRMGANLVRRLMRDGHRCVVYDVNAEMVKQLEGEGATPATSLGTRPSDKILSAMPSEFGGHAEKQA